MLNNQDVYWTCIFTYKHMFAHVPTSSYCGDRRGCFVQFDNSKILHLFFRVSVIDRKDYQYYRFVKGNLSSFSLPNHMEKSFVS